MDINFLPQELRPKHSILKVAKTLSKVALVGLVTLVTASVLMLSIFIFFSQRVQAINENQDKLTAQIKSLEATEQRLVLVKDRIEKISSVLNQNSFSSQLGVLKRISESLPLDATLGEVTVASGGIKFSLNVTSLDSVTSFFKFLTNEGFSSIKLIAFSYKPESGYGLVFEIKK